MGTQSGVTGPPDAAPLSLCFREPERFLPIQAFHERLVELRARPETSESSCVGMLRLASSVEEEVEEWEEGSELSEVRLGVDTDDEAGLWRRGAAARRGMVSGGSKLALEGTVPMAEEELASGVEWVLSLEACLSRFEEKTEARRRMGWLERREDEY